MRITAVVAAAIHIPATMARPEFNAGRQITSLYSDGQTPFAMLYAEHSAADCAAFLKAKGTAASLQ